MTQPEMTTRARNDLHAAIRRRITFHTLALISTPAGAQRREICATINDLENF